VIVEREVFHRKGRCRQRNGRSLVRVISTVWVATLLTIVAGGLALVVATQPVDEELCRGPVDASSECLGGFVD
jgi:hypothetical protein